jgi:hypothetical protein
VVHSNFLSLLVTVYERAGVSDAARAYIAFLISQEIQNGSGPARQSAGFGGGSGGLAQPIGKEIARAGIL